MTLNNAYKFKLVSRNWKDKLKTYKINLKFNKAKTYNQLQKSQKKIYK